MSSSDSALFLLILGLMLLLARGLGEIFRTIKQPMIIGEILAGILLGPTVLGMIAPDIYNSLFGSSEAVSTALGGFALVGVVMLLIVSGLEVDLSILVRQSKVALYTGLMGILFPFALGFGAAWYLPDFLGMHPGVNKLIFALFIGTALSITALPVVAKTLMDLNLFKSEIGYIIIASAMFNDIIGWLIFSIILSMINVSEHGVSIGSTITYTLLFVFFMLIFGRKLFNRIIPFIQNKFSFPGSILNFIFILGFTAAAFTEYIGVHAIFGAFIIGIAVGDSAHLKVNTRETIQQFVTNIFAPLFFISIGLKINFFTNFDLLITIFFILIATAAKVVGCGLGARLGGMSFNEAMAVGFGMNSRGAMEIILGLLALEYGLITERTFVALVIMAIVTSVLSGPMMSVYAEKIKKLRSLRGLLTPSSVYITQAGSKDEIIRELCLRAAAAHRLNETTLRTAVFAREETSSTGLVNGLALPHARIAIKEPLLMCAVSKEGIDFDSLDSRPSYIFFLLITPITMPDLQLQLLSEIAKPFSDDELARGAQENPAEFYQLLSAKIQ